MTSRVAVLGAGIQGISVALAALRRGHSVVLFDQERGPMLRASLRNEGKIHLGFIYANDRSMRTADLMLRSARTFAPLLDAWTSGIDWEALRTRPFNYLVMRDTMVPADSLLEHYAAVERRFADVGDGHYLGSQPSVLHRQVPLPSWVDADRVEMAVETAEVAVDLGGLRSRLIAALGDDDALTTRYGHRVEGVERTHHGFAVASLGPGGPERTEADVVVNCLWEGRIAIDEGLGLPLPDSWVYRLKYRVLARLPAPLQSMPSLTMVLGPYGDIVPMGDRSYLSWYPEGMVGWSREKMPPDHWDKTMAGDPDPVEAEAVALRVLAGLDTIVPGVARSSITAIDGGVIVGRGTSDIDDPESELHERSRVGVNHAEGYLSIDTGKFGCAPLFADEAMRLL